MSDEMKEQAEETAVDEKAVESPVEEKKYKCPRCGWEAVDKAKPNENDLKEYFRSILGDRSFSKEYPLCGGEVTLTFSTLQSEDATRMGKIMMAKDPKSDLELLEFALRLRMLFMLRSVKTATLDLKFAPPVVGIDGIDAEFDRRFGQLQDPLVQMCGRTQLLFSDLLQLLAASAYDENFWKAAGPF